MKKLFFNHYLYSIFFISFNSYSLTLTDALNNALNFDKQYQSDKINADLYEEKKIQARSNIFPKLSYSINHLVSNSSATGIQDNINGTQKYKIDSNSINFIQPLYNRSIWAEKNTGTLQAEIGELILKKARIDLFSRTVEKYIEIINSQNNLEGIEYEISLLKKQNNNEIKCPDNKIQCIENIDIYKLNDRKIRILQLEGQLENEKQGLIAKRYTLEQSTGPLPDFLELGVNHSCFIRSPAPRQIILNEIRLKNIDILIQKLISKIAENSIKQADSGHYPNADFIASHTKSQGVPLYPNAQISSNTYGVQIAIPIFNGFINSSKITEAKLLFNKSISDVDITTETAERLGVNYWIAISTAIEKIKIVELQITILNKQRSISQKNPTNREPTNGDSDIYEKLQRNNIDRELITVKNELLLRVLLLNNLISADVIESQNLCNLEIQKLTVKNH